MTKINVFGKHTCAKCKTTRNKLTHFLSDWQMDHAVQLVFHDLDTLDGRAEGAFYDVNQIPATVIEQDGRQVARWDGAVPNSQAVHLVLQSFDLEALDREGAHVAAH